MYADEGGCTKRYGLKATGEGTIAASQEVLGEPEIKHATIICDR